MHVKESIFVVVLFMLAASAAFPQKSERPVSDTDVGPIRSSAAYSEVLLRKTELQADLESLLADYTEINPKIIDIRFELSVLDKAFDKLYAVKPSETAKLTLALGKLIVRKAGLETDLLQLQRKYNKDHPEVKRLKRKVEIYESAIKEILP